MAGDKEGPDPYVYRGTTVLKNLAGLRDEVLHQAFETDFSVFRQAQLAARPLRGNFDPAHLQAIHRLGEINAMHPLREGNGRAQRTFIGELAQEHGLKSNGTPSVRRKWCRHPFPFLMETTLCWML